MDCGILLELVRVVAVVPTEDVPLWLVIVLAVICLPLLVYLSLRLRRARRRP